MKIEFQMNTVTQEIRCLPTGVIFPDKCQDPLKLVDPLPLTIELSWGNNNILDNMIV